MERLKAKIKRTSFQKKQFYSLVVVIVIPIVSLIAATAFYSKKYIRKGYEEQLSTTSELMQLEVSNWMDQGLYCLDLLSGLRGISAFTGTDASAGQQAPAGTLTNKLRKDVEIIKEAFPYVDSISLIDPGSGRILLAAPVNLEDRNRRNKTYFKKGAEGTFISPVAYSIGREKPVVTVAAPIRSGNDLVFVAAIEMDLEDLQKRFEDKSTYLQGVYSYLIDAYGFYVTTPQGFEKRPLGIKVADNILKAVKSSRSGFREYHLENEKRVLSKFVWLDGIDLCIVGEIAYSEISGIVGEIITVALFIGALIVVVGLFFARTLSRALVAPLLKISSAADELREGKMNTRIRIDTEDEIGNVALAFNHMADGIRDTHENLENLVRKRTAELTDTNRRLLVEIDERINAEHDLRESKEKFRMVFNSQLDAIFVLTPGDPPVITDCNSAAREIFEYGADELIGRTINRLHVDESHFREFHRTVQGAMDREGFLKDTPYSMKRKSGQVFPSEHVVLQMKGDRGERIGWISIVRDLTERKRIEADLRQARKMETMGTLAGGIAHDFNNLLSPIIGYSEMMEEEMPPGSPHHESVLEILAAALRARELVRQILTFSRLAPHEVKPVKLQPIVDEAIKLLAATIPSTIEIKTVVDAGCGRVSADPTLAHQIIMNLATNAYHAMLHEGGRLTISLKQTEVGPSPEGPSELPPGPYALLLVRDTGYGMDKKILGKIFDPYFTTKTPEKGTGLGLSVVLGAVKTMAGGIRVDSKPNLGTEVRVYLPILQTERADGIETPPPRVPGGNERILVVDDEASVAKMEHRMLERLGYRVVSRTSSREALETFKADPDAFDLLITDMTMPGMTGTRLSEAIKAVRSDIPVIICTGFSDQIDEANSGEFDIQGFIPKPVVKSDFARVLRTVLDKTIKTHPTFPGKSGRAD